MKIELKVGDYVKFDMSCEDNHNCFNITKTKPGDILRILKIDGGSCRIGDMLGNPIAVNEAERAAGGQIYFQWRFVKDNFMGDVLAAIEGESEA